MKTSLTHTSPAKLSLMARIDAWFERRNQRRVEAWLATSENVFELEARMRVLDRGDGNINF